MKNLYISGADRPSTSVTMRGVATIVLFVALATISSSSLAPDEGKCLYTVIHVFPSIHTYIFSFHSSNLSEEYPRARGLHEAWKKTIFLIFYI